MRAIQAEGEDVSMDTIAAEAGITKPILYSHFGDKAGLAEALAEQFAAVLTELLTQMVDRSGPPRETLVSAIDAYVSLIEAQPRLYRFLANGHVAGQGQRQLIDELAAMVSRELGERLRAAGADSGGAEPWAYAIVGMVDLTASWWLDRKTMSRSDLVDYLTKLVWDGLGVSGLGSVRPAGVTELKRRSSGRPRSATVRPT